MIPHTGNYLRHYTFIAHLLFTIFDESIFKAEGIK